MHLCGAKMPSFCLTSRRPRFLWHIFLVSKCVSARARARSHIPQLFYIFASFIYVFFANFLLLLFQFGFHYGCIENFVFVSYLCVHLLRLRTSTNVSECRTKHDELKYSNRLEDKNIFKLLKIIRKAKDVSSNFFVACSSNTRFASESRVASSSIRFCFSFIR